MTPGTDLIQSAPEVLDLAAGKAEPARTVTTTAPSDREKDEPGSADEQEDRFAWTSGDGMTVTGEGEGPVLFTYEDFGLPKP